ncbi:hypothetical protein Tco_0956092 [Tanacetum coccineum]|uniref:Retrovirus-related Pol polyprotein from transposon TNT 1-94-like beta-barrel domain-containing protein n=1 Tax=Tanacetum coccineum TaxID=301880 RepID=A0ABQ5E928_9ASTR
MSYLSDFKEFDGGYVTFGGGAKGGKITGKGTLKTGKLDFEDVYFVKELQFNLFSVSQMCDKKNSVLFTDTGCFVLSPDFKLADESQVLLKVPRKNNMYNVDMKNIVPKEYLTCLVAKATLDESILWHRRLESGASLAVGKSIKDFCVGTYWNSDGPKWLLDIECSSIINELCVVVQGTNSNDLVGRVQKGNPSIKRSKLDRSYAERLLQLQVTLVWPWSPKLGLWFLWCHPFDLEAYSDSDYAGASLDKKSTIGGTDIAKITRKRSKPGKLEHGNEKSAQKPEVSSKRSTRTRVLLLGMPLLSILVAYTRQIYGLDHLQNELDALIWTAMI